MASPVSHHDVHVLQFPNGPAQLPAYTRAFRDLRLKSLRESPQAYFETYEEAFARSEAEWQALVEHHQGLIQLTIATPKSKTTTIAAEADRGLKQDLILQHGTLLGLLVLNGPLPPDRFPPSRGLRIPPNRTDGYEQRYSVATMYHIPEMRETRRGKQLMIHTFLEWDRYLLENLQSAADEFHPVARLRCNVRPGPSQNDLISKYVHWGWHIVGTRCARENLVADGGVDVVRSAATRGCNDLDEVFTIMEWLLTVPQLEWQVRNCELSLTREGARL